MGHFMMKDSGGEAMVSLRIMGSFSWGLEELKEMGQVKGGLNEFLVGLVGLDGLIGIRLGWFDLG